MQDFTVQIKLLSEAIFGSGQSVPGDIDVDVVYDEYGIPYFKGKTFKGKVREEVENLRYIFKEAYGLDIDEHIKNMFGESSMLEDKHGILKFSDCTLDKKIIQALKYGIKSNMFTYNEVLNSLTQTRNFTSIDKDGISKDKSLRSARVIKKDICFFCKIEIEKELSDLEKALLASGISSLKSIGTMESRGKGEISARLYLKNKDITDEYINNLEKEVTKIG